MDTMLHERSCKQGVVRKRSRFCELVCVCSSRQDDQKTRDFSESRPLAHQAVFESHLRTVLAFLAEKFSEDL
jgi:hypothetical protein